MYSSYGRDHKNKVFLQYMNRNKYCIKFTSTCHPSCIPFLDLEIYKEGFGLGTCTHFKDTDWNGYISTRSCHHPNWVRAIPKGQFLRIKRNCAKEEDYMDQPNMLIGRFVEKGYSKQQLEYTSEQVRQIDCPILLKPKIKEPGGDQYNLAYISGFHLQYKEVKNIFKTHWPILQKDHTFKKILPRKPIKKSLFIGGPQGCAIR